MDATTQETLSEAFERQARINPDQLAVVHGTKQCTYRGLHERANQIALQLAPDVSPATYVGVFMQPSIDLVAAILAILRLGAAYVPIDASSPLERLNFVINDAQIMVILTDTTRELRPDTNPRIVRPASPSGSISLLENYPKPRADSDAYVIYTSGSTGKPKGVVCSHHNVTRLFQSTHRLFHFSPADRWSFFHSIAFDFSVWELFGALLHGGTIVIVEPDIARDTVRFMRLLESSKVTMLSQTPSAFYNLISALDSYGTGCLSHIRHVVLGGERVQCSKLARWFSLPGINLPKLINMYGITETTVHVTHREMSAIDVKLTPDSSPIGNPIDDLEVHLLDENLHPVRDGDAGEIFVSGPGVAKGYLRRPELTEKRFVRLSTPSGMGVTGYRSGDLARRIDGELYYLGRADRQVKIRGYRIELGEIESEIQNSSNVDITHVFVQSAGEFDARLAATLVPNRNRLPGAYAEAEYLETNPRGLLRLKSGLEVAYINRAEADFMDWELFESPSLNEIELYLAEDACVVDVGANIGMFSLFVMTQCRNPRIVAVEPIPECVEKLKLNLLRYNARATVHQIALSDRSGRTQFKHYPNATVMSGCYTRDEDKETMLAYLRNRYGGEDLSSAPVAWNMNRFVADSLVSTDLDCEVATLSQLIDRELLPNIDLLKIDVEKSEADVLRGIRDDHWPRIRQVLVEVHDTHGRLTDILTLFESHGFECKTVKEEMFRSTSLCTIYARRCHEGGATSHRRSGPHRLVSESELLMQSVREHLNCRLPSYMVPDTLDIVRALPLTANGKVDESKLIFDSATEVATDVELPSDSIEQRVKDIWQATLKTPELKVNKCLADVGANSLAAVMIAVQLYKEFAIEYSPKDLRGSATISSVASEIRKRVNGGVSESYAHG